MAEPVTLQKRIECHVITGEYKEIIISEIEFEQIKKEAAKREAEAEAKLTYIEKRRREYPPIQEQLDIMYHQGFDGWRLMIQTIKNKYPASTPESNPILPSKGGKYSSI